MMDKDKTYGLMSIVLIVMGVIMIIFGSNEVSDAKQVGDAMLYAEGMHFEYGGVSFMMLSLILVLYGSLEKIRKVLNETEKEGSGDGGDL
ncbi:MAG: hypothetical protein IKE94_06325 [Aeriscardovia sp.]|nr:hypothetical protein [Aeriscardovia sp.]